MYGKSIIYGLCLLLFMAPAVGGNPQQLSAQKTISIGAASYILEVATTPEQRAIGLMWRTEMPLDRGMLFDYPEEGNYRIWMKNTKIPLQVLWIGGDYRIQAVKTLVPCNTDPCLSYGIEQTSRYVIELNAGVTGIKPGMLVKGLE